MKSRSRALSLTQSTYCFNTPSLLFSPGLPRLSPSISPFRFQQPPLKVCVHLWQFSYTANVNVETYPPDRNPLHQMLSRAFHASCVAPHPFSGSSPVECEPLCLKFWLSCLSFLSPRHLPDLLLPVCPPHCCHLHYTKACTHIHYLFIIYSFKNLLKQFKISALFKGTRKVPHPQN